MGLASSRRIGGRGALLKLALPVLLAWIVGHACAQEGFLPLKSEKPGHISDLVLIYQGGVKRPEWTGRELAPYVSWRPEDSSLPEQWLFDGFLFIEFRDGRGRDYAKGYGGQPARQSDWRWLLEQNFSRTNALAALDAVIGRAATRIGAPPVPRKIVLTLPEPIHDQKDWGAIAGRDLDFSRTEDRVAACKWHIAQAEAFWRAAQFKHLQLAGFYWVAEHSGKAQEVLPQVANHIREKGFFFYWIPYWNAQGASQWRKLGFDYAWQQPNHFFHPEKVPDSRLGEAIAFARTHGLGLEFEADARAIKTPEAFRPRFYEYLKAFDRDGVKTASSVAYYEGGGALLQMAESKDPEVRKMYDVLAEWVADRGKTRVAQAAHGP